MMTVKSMRLRNNFYQQDVLQVAPKLLGKKLVRIFDNGTRQEYLITETEAYRGEEDKACRAYKGKTPRTQVMYQRGGVIYVYLIYGIYWMLNIVTGAVEHPQAVLIRGVQEYNGPGRVGKALQLDKSFYGEQLDSSQRIWIEEGINVNQFHRGKRIGIDYAGKKWANKRWRFISY